MLDVSRFFWKEMDYISLGQDLRVVIPSSRYNFFAGLYGFIFNDNWVRTFGLAQL